MLRKIIRTVESVKVDKSKLRNFITINLSTQEEAPQVSKSLSPLESRVAQFEIATATVQASPQCGEFSATLRDFLVAFSRTTQLTPSTSAAILCKIFNDLKISEEQH